MHSTNVDENCYQLFELIPSKLNRSSRTFNSEIRGRLLKATAKNNDILIQRANQ